MISGSDVVIHRLELPGTVTRIRNETQGRFQLKNPQKRPFEVSGVLWMHKGSTRVPLSICAMHFEEGNSVKIMMLCPIFQVKKLRLKEFTWLERKWDRI